MISLSQQIPPPPFFTPTENVDMGDEDNFGKLFSYLPDSYALYIHLPFCSSHCPFCRLSQALLPDSRLVQYLNRLEEHIVETVKHLPEGRLRPQALFIGGGTPTAIPAFHLGRLFDLISRAFDLSGLEEATIEANFESFTSSSSSELFSVLAGAPFINRISLGVQTFQPWRNSLLGRRLGVDLIKEVICRLDEKGFVVSVDLMHSVPGIDPFSIVSDAKVLVQLPALGVELNAFVCQPGTSFESSASSHHLDKAIERSRLVAFLEAANVLEKAGFEWHTPTHLSRGTLNSFVYEKFWHLGGSCLAFGSGVKGRFEDMVYFTSANLDRFIESQSFSESVESILRLAPGQASSARLLERIMSGSFDPFHIGRDWSKKLIELELVKPMRSTLVLTRKGRYFVANIADAIMGPSLETRADKRIFLQEKIDG